MQKQHPTNIKHVILDALDRAVQIGIAALLTFAVYKMAEALVIYHCSK